MLFSIVIGTTYTNVALDGKLGGEKTGWRGLPARAARAAAGGGRPAAAGAAQPPHTASNRGWGRPP